MSIINPQAEWEKFRVGIDAENGDRQLGTANRNWEQREDNLLQQTSGTLVKGQAYRLKDWITDDDFSNLGFANEDYRLGRETVATGTTPTKWTNSSIMEKVGTSRFRRIPPHWHNLYMAFMLAHATTPDDTTASVFIYLYFEHGPAMYVGDYNLTAGDMDVVRYPYSPYEGVLLKNWVNTIALVAEQWLQTPDIIASGTNEGVAMLRIPTFGAAGVLVEVDAVGSGVTADVVVTGNPQALGPA